MSVFAPGIVAKPRNFMRLFTTVSFLLLGAPLAAQGVALSEDFSGSTFPPAGWTESRLGPNFEGWKRQANGTAWHEDFLGATTENYLITPPLDLSTYSQAFLHFEGQTNYAEYLANHPTSYGDGVSNIEVSTDGGLSWTILWTDTSQASYDTYGPTIDLSAYAGLPDVRIGFYFYGTYAQEWWIDNVIVDDTPVAILATQINPSNGHPYFLLGESDFDTAQAMAISLGGNLVSVENSAENTWIQTTFSNFGGTQRNLILGLTDRALEGTFSWISGEGVVYTNWAAGEPNNGGPTGEDYVEMLGNGTWNDFNGSGAFGVVEISQPRIQTTPLVAGEMTTITVNGLRVSSEVILVFSVIGAGPTDTPYGVLEVDADMITPTFPSENGQFNFSTYLPASLSGRTLYGQGIQFNSDSTTDLSEPFAEPIL